MLKTIFLGVAGLIAATSAQAQTKVFNFTFDRGGERYAGNGTLTFASAVDPATNAAVLRATAITGTVDYLYKAPDATEHEFDRTWTIEGLSDFFSNSFDSGFNLTSFDGTGAGLSFFINDGPMFLAVTGSGADFQLSSLELSADGSFGFVTAAAAVPEPATWAMMIGGFGVMGGALRRRRVTARVRFA